MSEEITQDTEENIRNNIESASFNDITDRIMKDLEDAKNDISQKVDYAKNLIAATLKFYKLKSRSSSSGPENDAEDNNHLIKYGSNLNAKAEDIDEETLIENEEYSIIKQAPSFSRLVDRVETELLKINDNTKSLAESTKLAIRNYLETNKPKSEDNDINIITQPTNSFNSLQNFNEQTKALLEKTELNLRESNRVPSHHFTVLTMNLQLFDYKGKEPIVNCDCLPSCTDLTYSLEISQNNFVYKPHNIDDQLDEDYEYSIVNLYFKRNHIETKERSELYGFSDFIANFGGLLGLFTGFSMLSFIEIIYFLSLRIWGNIKMYGNWSGQHK